mmetsp:Transcript_29422/g.64274  ORF Transcript_29422/g.64274 Transcript_29422/m.64274 type:complete len:85 (-) Transcript_29422:60-314(-)
MYAHYASPVRWARPFITGGQLLQFVVVITIHTYGYSSKCYDMEPVWLEWAYCQSVVVGYFFLFCNFAYQQYIFKKKRATTKKLE